MTAQLSPLPVFRAWNNLGFPLIGGKLFTYVAGTTTKQASYTDASGTTPNTNPVILNFRGEANVWLDPTKVYKLVLAPATDTDPPSNPFWTVDQISGGAGSPAFNVIPTVDNLFTLGNSSFSWANVYIGPNHATVLDTSTGNIGYYARTAAEISASVAPTNFSYLPGDGRRYGADPSGAFDSTTAINNALKSNNRVYLIAGTYTCSAPLLLISGQTLFGDGSATILQFANASIHNIVGNGITNTTVRDLKITVTGSGSVTTTGAILLHNNAKYCKVLTVEITGVQWAGVWILGSSNNTVKDCYFHGFTGAQANTSDVIVTNDGGGVNLCDYNIVEGNQCFGGGYFGVTFQQFYSSDTITPRYNIAANNRIGQHTEYGILFYNSLSFTDTFNEAIGNYIELIQGTPNTSSGTGIYNAGQGGIVIANNVIRNCCAVTLASSLTPAGIGLNGVGGTNQAPFTIVGNHIENMIGFRGIEVASWNYGGVISGNTISFNNFAPDYGIYVLNSSNVAITGNNINIIPALGTTRGIYVNAAGATQSGIAITGNTINGCSFRGIALEGNGGFFITNFTISGNSVQIGSTLCIGIAVSSVVSGAIANNNVSCPSAAALSINTATTVRVTGNNFFSAGAISISTVGTCTGSYFDKTNSWNVSLNNAATGLIVEYFSSVNPNTTGNTFAVGDRGEQSVPVVGSPKGWRCTVAGAPGTWVSEGVL